MIVCLYHRQIIRVRLRRMRNACLQFCALVPFTVRRPGRASLRRLPLHLCLAVSPHRRPPHLPAQQSRRDPTILVCGAVPIGSHCHTAGLIGTNAAANNVGVVETRRLLNVLIMLVGHPPPPAPPYGRNRQAASGSSVSSVSYVRPPLRRRTGNAVGARR